jgi:phosphoglycerate dehydrogenase-like enzyme
MKVLAASYNPDVQHVYDEIREVLASNGDELRLVECDSSGDLRREIGDTEVLIAWKVGVDSAVLDSARKLRLIMASGSGYDHIDVKAAETRSIQVTNSGVYNAVDVAQHTVALVLACARKLPNLVASHKAEPWPLAIRLPAVHRFEQTRVSIIGYGSIGSIVARMLGAIGFEVAAFDPFVDSEVIMRDGIIPVTFDEAMVRADVVSLHLRLNDETRNILNGETLRLLPIGAAVVNTSRGGLVDKSALIAALVDGRLSCAGIDVLPEEPPTHDDPILSAPNLFLTGHSAGVTTEAEQEWKDALLSVLDAYRLGIDLPNRVV